jgi:hypothetical protein
MSRMTWGISSVGSGRPFDGSTSCSQPRAFLFHLRVTSRVAARPGTPGSLQALPTPKSKSGAIRNLRMDTGRRTNLYACSIRSRCLRSALAAQTLNSTLSIKCFRLANEADQAFSLLRGGFDVHPISALSIQTVTSLQSPSERAERPHTAHIDALGDCIDWNVPTPSLFCSRILVAICSQCEP